MLLASCGPLVVGDKVGHAYTSTRCQCEKPAIIYLHNFSWTDMSLQAACNTNSSGFTQRSIREYVFKWLSKTTVREGVEMLDQLSQLHRNVNLICKL